ncbi:MAG: hypothetical protein VKP63_07750 [Cyanobacteriota bacterium]|nr:hypothetical protein [Cyanobacteriota bacterium]
MSASPPSITLDPAAHPALSYAGLRAEALELLGRLCGEQWSDFNSHDPGITILEQLCYALTELAWRCEWPIADLLASAGMEGAPAPEAILRGDPVTRDDLVGLLRSLGCQAVLVDPVDQPELPLYFRPSSAASLPGPTAQGPAVAGDLELEANLETSQASMPPQPVTPRGVWRVAAQLGSGAPGEAPASLLPIARQLHGARLLGRDYTLAALAPFEVVVRMEIELVSPTVPPDLMARLRACLDAAIREAAARGERGGLRAAALLQALQALPEVRRVISLALAPGTEGPFHPWHLALPAGRGGRLHPASDLRLSHHGLPLEAPPAPPPGVAVRALPAAATPAAAASPRPGRRRELSRHRSLARQLPAVYGVGPAGLPADATPERRAQALQLRAYLLFFDQLLANGQAQLARATHLLAPVDPGEQHPLDADGVLLAADRDLPLTDLSDLLQGAPADWEASLRQALRASAPPGAAQRRSALLAHLLRRFGEELELPAGQATEPALVTARSEFLRRIAPLTAGRGSGPDLLTPERLPATPPAPGEAGQGPCAERLRRKLGLPLAADGTPPLLLIEHLLLRPLADDSSQRVRGGEDPIPFLSDVARPDPWSGRVSVVINAAALPSPADAERDRWLVGLLRQELPAHLRAELHLLADDPATPGRGPWSDLLTAWRRFRALLQAHRLAGLGGPAAAADDRLAPLLLSLRLRDSRDRLLSLLRIGLPWPLRAIPLPDTLMVPSGKTAAIALPYSQRGVRYQLVDVASGVAVGQAADGTDGPLTLRTPPITIDLILRVQASVLAPRPPAGAPAAVALTASGRARSTLLEGEIWVVEGVDVSLPLRLLDLRSTPLPRLHPDGAAVLADHGQRLLVEIDASQEGVVYEVIDNAQRGLPFHRHTPLSAKVTGTSRAIRLEVYASASEDIDLAVRASLVKSRGRNEDRQVLTTVLPLRVRANPAVPLRLLTPIVNPEARATVTIGDGPGLDAIASQPSASYLLRARLLADDDWRFDDPASASALTTISGPLDAFPSSPCASGDGNGAALTLQPAIGGEGMVLAALARKQHRLSPFDVDDPRTHPTEIPLRQAAVAYTRPDARRRLILCEELEGPCVWSLWGGQPGVAYSMYDVAANGVETPLAVPLPLPERADAPAGLRGIGRQRLGRDLIVSGANGAVAAAFHPDPAQATRLKIQARFLRSGVEALLDLPPLLVRVEPWPQARGDGDDVVVLGLAPGQSGRVLRGTVSLREGTADGNGCLRLPIGPLGGAMRLQLEVAGLSCPVWIHDKIKTGLVVRVRDFRPVRAGATAQLLDWGGRVSVEVVGTESHISYCLIQATDRDKPLDQQTVWSETVSGTAGSVVLLSRTLVEDVDLLVRGTGDPSGSGRRSMSRCLTTVVPLRVRANPAVPLELGQPVLSPGDAAMVWVGDGQTPSQASVTYQVWSRPLRFEDWRWDGAAESAMPLTTPPPLPPPAEWIARGEPLPGTDGIPTRGIQGRPRLSHGPLAVDSVVVVVASKRHNPLPLGTPTTDSVTTEVVLATVLIQHTLPNTTRRLVLVADERGWCLVGGEPGCFHTILRQVDLMPLAPPVYVHQRASEAPVVNWGLGRLRLGLDLAVSSEAGPGLTGGPSPDQLRDVVVEARRSYGGARSRFSQPLLVTQVRPASGDDTVTLVVWGLSPSERVRLCPKDSPTSPTGPTPARPAGSWQTGDPTRLGSGAVAVGAELTLEFTQDGDARVWTVPVRVLPPERLTP